MPIKRQNQALFSVKNISNILKCHLLLFKVNRLMVNREADLVNPCPAEPGYTLPLQTV